MIKFTEGDFFDHDADIRVNTVNCVGVMGAGVALLFKKKYPDMFRDYVRLCKSGELRPGEPTVWREGDILSKSIDIINFPTKDDWKNPSEYEYVESGLRWLSDYLADKKGKTVTLPALGCGHGGLEWNKVKALIFKYLSNSPAEILVFEPVSSKKAGRSGGISSESKDALDEAGVKIVSGKSSEYPVRLHSYTEKDLYIFSRSIESFEFDVSLIISSSPEQREIDAAEKIAEYCSLNNFSLLLGGASFDKKLAYKVSKIGIKVGCFLPSGIAFSAEKLRNSDGDIVLMSLGDPFVKFDKKSYMQAALSRIFLSKNVVLLMDKVSWLEKHKAKVKESRAKLFYIDYPEVGEARRNAALTVGAKKISYQWLMSGIPSNGLAEDLFAS